MEYIPDPQQLIPHLFRTEFSKICSVLIRHFGFDQVDVAEDLASETFCAALETWPYDGVPENPSAWLYKVARNKALNYVKRKKFFQEKIAIEFQSGHADKSLIFEDKLHVLDSQLMMLFAVCDPGIPTESQVGLALKILCGFSVSEIATAFLTKEETIRKRLQRGKEKLKEIISPGDLSEISLKSRLSPVLKTIYLLFNEGYYSETSETLVREELCIEAIHLCRLLLEHPPTKVPEVHALFALMSLQASRIPSRVQSSDIILIQDQDENLWDQFLISQGTSHLHESINSQGLSTYHLEACIAWWHTQKEGVEKWSNILWLYDKLLLLDNSPFTALNRSVALWKVHGATEAIRYVTSLQMDDNHFYHYLLGELYSEVNPLLSLKSYQKAFKSAKTERDRDFIYKKFS